MDTLLREILTSRVYEVARETPLDAAPRLSHRLENDVLLKREDLQTIFSFKLRGAYNRIVRLQPDERARGVVAASAGNHAQGVAFSARCLGLRAVIVMPRTTPEIKVDAVKALGAEVVLADDDGLFARPALSLFPGEFAVFPGPQPGLRPAEGPANDQRAAPPSAVADVVAPGRKTSLDRPGQP